MCQKYQNRKYYAAQYNLNEIYGFIALFKYFK